MRDAERESQGEGKEEGSLLSLQSPLASLKVPAPSWDGRASHTGSFLFPLRLLKRQHWRRGALGGLGRRQFSICNSGAKSL